MNRSVTVRRNRPRFAVAFVVTLSLAMVVAPLPVPSNAQGGSSLWSGLASLGSWVSAWFAPDPAEALDPAITWSGNWGRTVTYNAPEPHRQFLLPQYPRDSVSGDGTVMAATLPGPSNSKHFVLYNNRAGGYKRPVPSDSTTYYDVPVLSTTGRYAAMRVQGAAPGHSNTEPAVYRYDLATGAWDRLAGTNGCVAKGISADGTTVAVDCGTRSSTTGQGASVRVIKVGQGDVFTADPGWGAKLSADGSYLAYARWSSDGPAVCTEDNSTVVYRVTLATGDEQAVAVPDQVVNDGTLGGYACTATVDTYPSGGWDMSPDGQSFAWSTLHAYYYSKYFGWNYTGARYHKRIYGWRDDGGGGAKFEIAYHEGQPDETCSTDALNTEGCTYNGGAHDLVHLTNTGSLVMGDYGTTYWPGGSRAAGQPFDSKGTFPNGREFGFGGTGLSDDGQVLSGIAQSGWIYETSTLWCGGGWWSGTGLDTCAAVATLGSGWPAGEPDTEPSRWQPAGTAPPGDSTDPELPEDQAVGAAFDGAAVGTVADPVNTATGDLTEQHTDIARPDLRTDVSIGRTYNSGDSRSGVLGRGWRASFELTASTDSATGAVTVAHPSGRRVVYAPDPNGGYATPPGAVETLAQSNGVLRLDTPNQTVEFDAAGNVARVVGTDTGEAVTYTYTDGRVTRVAGATRHIDLTYDASGRLAAATADDGRAVTYGYTNDLLTSVTSPGGKTVTYTYDDAGLLRSATGPGGVPIHETDYDTAGRVVAQRDANDGETTIAYAVDDTWTGTVTTTDPSGGVWVDTYARRILTQRRSSDGVATKYTYNAKLALVRQQDPFGITSFTYDAAGRLTKTTTPEGAATTTYDSNGRLAARTTLTGATTSNTYDAAGRLTHVTAPDEGVTSYTYNAADLIASVTDAEGAVTMFTYNAAGQVTQTTGPTGIVETRTYTPEGWLESVTSPAGTVAYTYTPDGDIKTATDPANRVTTTTYDAAGRVARNEDHAGRFTAYSYDAAGRVSATTDHAGRDVGLTYDTSGRVAVKTDVTNKTATFTYDAAGRVSSVTDAHGAVTFEYDEKGLRSRATRPDGSEIVYGYDARGRLTSIAGGSDPVTYTYDEFGRVSVERRGPAQSITYTYNTLGQVTSARSVDTVAGIDETTQYTYDKVGRVATTTRPNGVVDRLAYFPDGQLRTIHRGTTLHATYAYDGAGRLSTVTLGDGSVERYTYDELSRPLTRRVTNAANTTVLDREEITYDNRGNPASVVRRDGTTTYAYDNADQLVRVCTSGVSPCTEGAATESFTYDATGNRLTRTTSAGTDVYTYNANEQLTKVTAASGAVVQYAYDARGRVTSAGALTLTYDDGTDQLIGARHTDGRSWTYRYDVDGRRVQSTATVRSKTTTFKYGNDPLTGELISRSGGRTVDQYLPANVGRAAGSAFYYNHADRLGSLSTVTTLSRKAPAVKHAYGYEPFGVTRSTSTPDPSNERSFGDHPTGPAGLLLMNGRPYDPTLGRFLTADPQGSLYNFANNSPILFADPSGQIPCLGSWGDFKSCLVTAAPVAETVATVSTAIGAGLTMTGVGAPAGAFFLGAGRVAGAVGLAGRMISAADACAAGKGSCASQVGSLALDAALSRVRAPRGASHVTVGGANPPSMANHVTASGANPPPIKPGSAGGSTAGQRFPPSVKRQALEENPSTCVYCRMETSNPQVDHSIPRSRGGDATLENAQTTCPWCNPSKGARDYPVNPPRDYEGPWPPPHWDD